jgi:hypothetical protein
LTRLRGRSPFGEAKARQSISQGASFLMDARIIPDQVEDRRPGMTTAFLRRFASTKNCGYSFPSSRSL